IVATGCPVARSKTVIGEGGVGPSRGRRDACATTRRLPSPENARAETSANSFHLSRVLKRATFCWNSRRSQRTRISVGGLPTPAPLLYFTGTFVVFHLRRHLAIQRVTHEIDLAVREADEDGT